jgi:hypothetical protein
MSAVSAWAWGLMPDAFCQESFRVFSFQAGKGKVHRWLAG